MVYDGQIEGFLGYQQNLIILHRNPDVDKCSSKHSPATWNFFGVQINFISNKSCATTSTDLVLLEPLCV